MNSDIILEKIIKRAAECIKNEDFEGAFQLYSDVADITPDTEEGMVVKYNLASMYAQGLGCEKDLIKAASLFNECSKSGDEDALKRILKCFMDYVIDNSHREISEFSANINKFVSVVFTDENEALYIIKELRNYFYDSGREEIAEKLSGYLADSEFTIDNGVLVKYKRNDETVEIPNGVTVIGEGVFAGKFLKEIVIPHGVEEIGFEAFFSCCLEEIIIPDSVKKIEDGAFEGCMALKKVFIPDSVETIGDYVFSSCFSLNEITLPKNLKEIGYNALASGSLKKIYAPKDLDLSKTGYPKGCEIIRY